MIKKLRIISKSHAYLQTMTKTTMKFRKNRYKTVGGVAQTRHPLSIHFDTDNARKMASTCVNSDKNNLRIISKPHACIQTVTKTLVKFPKKW